MKKVFILISALFLLGCEADPGLKKIPKKDPRLISKGVGLNFYPQVDILFVVDDSGSMEQFQITLSNNVDTFIDTIFQSQFIDFHIGVTTSNNNEEHTTGLKIKSFFPMEYFWAPTWNGRLISLLDRKDKSSVGPNFVHRDTLGRLNILRTYLTPGTDGDGDEMFFSMVRDALTEPLVSSENAGFYRKDAHLVIFFLTDAEDQSIDFSPQQFKDFLLELKGGDESLIHYAGAVGPVGTDCRHPDETEPHLIEEFTRLINGTNFNICDADYGKELVKIASDIVERVSVIHLDDVPRVSTIEVSYGSQTVPQSAAVGWTYDPVKNVIYLGRDLVLEPEPPGTQLKIHFESIFK